MLGEILRTPSFANLAFGAATVAFGKQHSGKCKPAFCACRLAASETPNRRGIAALVPQSSLRALAEQANARPVRILGDECCVTAEINLRARVAQNVPFDHLLTRRIADRFF